MSGGFPANPGAGAAPAPCKIAPDPSGQYDFQVRAADMPVKVKLCENHQGDPATTSKFNQSTEVLSLATSPPTAVPGQPTGIANTSFSLSLAVGVYMVEIVLTPLPNSLIAYVYEDCAGSNQLVHILTNVQLPSNYFTLRVV